MSVHICQVYYESSTVYWHNAVNTMDDVDPVVAFIIIDPPKMQTWKETH